MGRPKGPPSATRSVRLPVTEWERLDQEAKAAGTSVNAIIARAIGRAAEGQEVGAEPPTPAPPPKAQDPKPAKPAKPASFAPRRDTYPEWMRGKK